MSKNAMEIYRTRLKYAHILAEAKDFRQAHSIVESTLNDASNLLADKAELAEVLLLAGSLPDEYTQRTKRNEYFATAIQIMNANLVYIIDLLDLMAECVPARKDELSRGAASVLELSKAIKSIAGFADSNNF